MVKRVTLSKIVLRLDSGKLPSLHLVNSLMHPGPFACVWGRYHLPCVNSCLPREVSVSGSGRGGGRGGGEEFASPENGVSFFEDVIR